jgi:hypothetical protein
MSRKYWRNSIWIKPIRLKSHSRKSLRKGTDPFWSRQEGDEVLGSEYPYLSVIEALMYLANNARPDIAFAVNLLARYSATPTMRHWNGVKDVLRYLCGTPDLGLLYPKN